MEKLVSVLLAFVFVLSCSSSGLKIKKFNKIEEAVADNALDLDKEIPAVVKQKHKLAIMPVLTSDGDTTELGDRISELYYLYLFKLKKFQIIERKRIDSFLSEHSFENSGLVDSEKIKELGKILSVDYILVGTLRENGKYISLTTRIIDIESAGLLTTAVTNITVNNKLLEELRAAKNIAGSYSVEIETVIVNKDYVADTFSDPDIVVEFTSSTMKHKSEKYQDTYKAENLEKFNITLINNDTLKITIYDIDVTQLQIIDEFLITSDEIKKILKESRKDFYELSHKKASIKFKMTKV